MVLRDFFHPFKMSSRSILVVAVESALLMYATPTPCSCSRVFLSGFDEISERERRPFPRPPLPPPAPVLYPPGEELLIDYGSARKDLYRFARTYGFVGRAPDDVGSTSGPAPMCRVGRLRVAAEEAGVAPHVAGAESTDGRNRGTPVQGARPGDGTGGRRSTVDVPVDVSIIDMALSRLGDRAPEDTTGPSAVESGDGVARLDLEPLLRAVRFEDGVVPPTDEHEKAVLCSALERRLARYGTGLEEDLLAAGGGGGGAGGPEAEGDASGGQRGPGKVARADWLSLCARVRAAEKVALLSAIRACRHQPARGE